MKLHTTNQAATSKPNQPTMRRAPFLLPLRRPLPLPRATPNDATPTPPSFQVPPPTRADFDMLREYGYDPLTALLEDQKLQKNQPEVSLLSTMDEGQEGAPSLGPTDELLADLIKAEAGGGDVKILDFIRRYRALIAEGAIKERDPQGRPNFAFKAEEVLSLFPFQLDKFQERSFRAVLQGESVVVCAPTGAGKTAIAEACSIAMLSLGKRVIYTTPLKALSNQKLYELREKFGSENIGLQTGDISLNSEANITVMTTEVLRNILYRAMVEEEESAKSNSNSNSSSNSNRGATVSTTTIITTDGTGDAAPERPDASQNADGSVAAAGLEGTALARLGDVGLVILDEVHYMSDPDRGSVWEEVILHTPKSTQLLCMSATVANPEDLGGWIRQVHGPCRNINTSFRPVPLKWWYLHEIGFKTQLMPLLAPGARALSREVEAFRAKGDKWRGSPRDRDHDDWERGGRGAGRGRGRGGDRERERDDRRPSASSSRGRGGRGDDRDRDRDRSAGPAPLRMGFQPPVEDAVYSLKDQNMLPAIWFIFSRVGCDRAALDLHARRMVLTKPEEQAIIKAEVEALQRAQPEAVRPALVGPLISGLAAHHAGYLPSWKTLIEKLFQRGLLKLVFATDTLSAGINMPARTTVISQLSRRRGERGTVPLTHNELFQMAGRAGRRGFDTEGHCVLVHSGLEGPEDAFEVITRGPEALVSQFSAGYGMALSLLASRTLDEAKDVVDRSFGAYLGGDGIRDKMMEIEDLEARALQLETDVIKRQTKKAGGKPMDLPVLPADLESPPSGAFADETTSDAVAVAAAAAAARRLSQLEDKLKLEGGVLRQIALQAFDSWLSDSIVPLVEALLPAHPENSLPPAPTVALVDPTGLGALSVELGRAPEASDVDGSRAPPLIPALVLGRATEGDLAAWGLLAVGHERRGDAWESDEWGLAEPDARQDAGLEDEDDEEDIPEVEPPSSSSSGAGDASSEGGQQQAPAEERPFELIRTLTEMGLPKSVTATSLSYVTPYRILCLTTENQILVAGPEHIAGMRTVRNVLDDGPLPELPAASAAALTDPATCQRVRSACEAILMDTAEAPEERSHAGALTSHIEAPYARPGGATTASAALLLSQLVEALDERLAGVDVIRPDQEEEGVEDEEDPAALLTELGFQAFDPHMVESVLFQWDVLRDTKSKVIEARSGAAPGPRLTKTMERKLTRANKLRRKATRLRRALEAQQNVRWRSFEDVLSVLVEFGAVEKGTFRALPLGELARKLRGENELWLAVALMHPSVQALPGPALAGTLAALIAHGSIGGRPKVWSKYSPSEAVTKCVLALERDRARLLKLQMARGGSLADKATEGLTVDLRLSGLVEAWAAGASWEQIMSDCNLDDGDVARLLLRTTDMLKQVANLEDAIVWPPLRVAARNALKEMTRSPISDLLKTGG